VGSALLTLCSAALAFQAANDGSRLLDAIAQDSPDARQRVQMGVAQSAGQVCEAVGVADSGCAPCPDGARVCFGASIGGLAASRQ
jgi:hypothetical protein